MKKIVEKRPILANTHLPLILLGAVMVVYGLLTAVMNIWLANRAMSGLITAPEYRSRLTGFEQTAGLVTGIILLVMFLLTSIRSSGRVRTAFAIGAVAALSPILAGRVEGLLFNVIGIPTMGAGSVIAGAVVTLLFFLPMSVLFIILATGRSMPRGVRWISLVGFLVVLVTSFYPIYVTVLAFLFKPGDPAVGRMIQTSTQVIRLRFLLPGLVFLLLAWISTRFSQQQTKQKAAPQSVEQGE